jgi:hypothetical protein
MTSIVATLGDKLAEAAPSSDGTYIALYCDLRFSDTEKTFLCQILHLSGWDGQIEFSVSGTPGTTIKIPMPDEERLSS